ncbi:MAG: hypothetical protein U1G07_08850 [Verrucomicrobiota bacterium]
MPRGGADEVTGILQLLRGARHHTLHLLEQARCFVDELKTERGMSVAEDCTATVPQQGLGEFTA